MGKYIGIDLGTTFSVAAYIDDNGNPQVINNQEGENITPSAVLFEDGAIIVGADAKNSSMSNPDHYVAFAKRDMGSKQKRFMIDGEAYTPEEISALVLKKIKQDAQAALGEEILGAVITVPAYFTDAQRMSTRDAARMADIPVLAIINEPTAAALAYGITKGGEDQKKILVYDLGGGTFDVSIMQFDSNSIEILASAGDSQLGGYDFDQQIINWFKQQAKAQGADIDRDPVAQQTLQLEAERAKKSLSSGRSKVRMTIPVMGKPVNAELTKDQFESMIDPYVFQSISLMNAALDEANVDCSELDKILLVGGSTRIPLVRQMIKEETEIEPSMDIHPDEVVAIGAAFHAVERAKQLHEAQTDPEPQVRSQKDAGARGDRPKPDSSPADAPKIDIDSVPKVDMGYTFTDRTSHGIGVEVWDDSVGGMINSVVLPENSVVPAEGFKDYSTTDDYQQVIKLIVRQGETSELKYTTVIGETELRLRPKPKGSPIRVVVSCDTDSIIHVHVIDLTDNEDLGEMRINRVANLTDEEVRRAQNRLGKLNIGWED